MAYSSNKLRSIIFILLLWLVSPITQASDAEKANEFFSRLDLLLEGSIPELSEILSNYKRPSSKGASLIIGVLANESDDDINWGLIISDMTRVNLNSLPSQPIDVGSLDLSILKYDARSDYYEAYRSVDLTRFENLKILGQRYGIDRVLNGTVKKVNNSFNISLVLTDLKYNIQTKTVFSFEQKNLAHQLKLIIEWVYEQTGGNDSIDLNTIHQIGSVEIGLLKDFSPILESYYFDNHKIFPKAFEAKLNNESYFPTAQFYQTLYQRQENTIDEHNNKIEKIASKYPNHQAIKSASGTSYWHLNQASLLKHRIKKLELAIMSSPVEYSGFLEMTNSLVNAGNPLTALTVAREQVHRWPNRHRSWWQLSYVLKELAWYYRGEHYWKDVPKKGKLLYRGLIDYSKQSIDIAISLHPSSGLAYGNRISLHGGYAEEVKQDLYKAIQYDPQVKYIYNDALHYSASKWGGSYAIQKDIFETAVEHDLSQVELEELWYKFIEPNQTIIDKVIIKIFSQFEFTQKYLKYGPIDNSQLLNKKSVLFYGLIALGLLGLYFTKQTKQRKLNEEIISVKEAELWNKLTNLKQKLKINQQTLIIERQDGSFILPQLEQYYFLNLTQDGLKIESHFGEINGDIDESITTMLQVIETAARQLK